MELDLPIDELGPKMRALRDDRQRRFCWLVANGGYSASAAAREAGYSDVKEGAKVRAHELMQRAGVRAAIEECGSLVFRGLAPLAIDAARKILQSPKHRAHARMIEVVLDRTGFGPKAEVDVSVKHSVDFREVEALARRLAAESGIDPARLLGPNVIEGEVVGEDVSARASAARQIAAAKNGEADEADAPPAA